MPYDEEGRYIYPQPARKSPAKSGKSPVKRRTQPPTTEIPLKPAQEAVITENSRRTQPPPTEVPKINLGQAEPELFASTEIPLPINLGLANEKLVSPTKEMPKGKNKAFEPEKFGELGLAYVWNAQNWPGGAELSTTTGEKVEVVYRGRWSGNFGPDFKGALLNIGGELRRGDVELHLKTSGWRQHGHHQDKRYNQVVLQVVLIDDEPAIGPDTAAGNRPPLLVMGDMFEDSASLQAAIEQTQKSGTRLGSVSESAGPCCERVAERHPDLLALLDQIDQLGEARFLDKVLLYEAACSGESGGAAQAIWAGLLEALGYSQNKAPFRTLAALLPFTTVVEIELAARSKRESEAERLLTLEAALLGAAGLLPSQRRAKKAPVLQGQMLLDDKPSVKAVQTLEKAELQEDWAAGRYTDELERRWQYLERHIRAVAAFEADFKALQATDWTFARLRPPNHPSRRIAGLARLLSRLKMRDSDSLHEALSRLVLGAASPTQACAKLDEYFGVTLASPTNAIPLELDSESDEFWARRFDFAERAILVSDPKAKAGLDLVGADRAADIVVNVALPFLVGFARCRHDFELEDAALAAYRAHPRLGSNELIDNVARQVFRYWLENPTEQEIVLDGKPLKKLTVGKLLDTARRQQGLIHLHRRFCTEQDYSACPLG